MKKKKQGLILALVSFIVFLLASISIFFRNLFLDSSISNYIQEIQTPLANLFFIFLGHYSKIIMIIIALFFIWILYFQKKKISSIIFASTLLVGYLVKEIIKLSLQRERPLPQLLSETGFSFPSGHSVFAITLFSLIIYFYKDEIKNQTMKYLFIATNVFLILLVGLSRIYLNVHWFSDVIGGYALGFFLVNIGILVSVSSIYRR